LWAVVKYSRAGLHYKQEEDEGGREEGQGANHHQNNDDEDTESEDEDEDEEALPKLPQHESNDADDLLLHKICPSTDDNDDDPPLPAAVAAEEPSLPPFLRPHLLLLTYKAVVAAHFMGPRNPYTIFAIRRLWEKTQRKPSLRRGFAAPPALAPHLGHWLLFPKLRDVYNVDVRASLLLSDGYILAESQVQVPPHLSLLSMEEGRAREGPLSLGLAEAACGWPLPALYPPRLMKPTAPAPAAAAAAAAAAAGGGGGGGGVRGFCPRSLPVATARATQVAIRKAFRKVKRDRKLEKEEKEGRKKQKKQQKLEGGGGGGGGAGGEEEDREGDEVEEEEEGMEGMNFENGVE